VQVPSTLPAGSPVSLLVESVTPASAVYAVWRRNPETGAWEAGYLRGQQQLTEFDAVAPRAAVTVCVDAVARLPLG
jgi:hypothetical protein